MLQIKNKHSFKISYYFHDFIREYFNKIHLNIIKYIFLSLSDEELGKAEKY